MGDLMTLQPELMIILQPETISIWSSNKCKTRTCKIWWLRSNGQALILLLLLLEPLPMNLILHFSISQMQHKVIYSVTPIQLAMIMVYSIWPSQQDTGLAFER